MTKWIIYLLQRIVWPGILIICSFMRPVGISFVYLLTFFIAPFISIANAKNIQGSVGAYFVLWITITSLLMLLHIAFQIIIIILGYEYIGQCSFTEILLRHIGFINLIDLEPLAIVEWIAPEVIIFSMSLLLHTTFKKMLRISSPIEDNTIDNEIDGARLELNEEYQKKKKLLGKFIHIGPFVSLAILCMAAVMRPSIPGGIYFITFLCSGTYWACYKSLSGRYRIILHALLVILVAHTFIVFMYQTPWPQQFVGNATLTARLMGLEPLFMSSCLEGRDVRMITFNESIHLDSYLYPILILVSYYVIAITSKNLPGIKDDTKSKPFSESIALNYMPIETNDAVTNGFDDVIICLQSSLNFLYIHSYIFTSIIMMVWSIVYHSWLTFVLLIWANILWMIPNQRKIMLKSSPFIVIYAECLLIAQYIYGMNLNDQELPSTIGVKGVNLRQIGLVKPLKYPCAPLILKTCFTLMFWTTMRQLFVEKVEGSQLTTLVDVAAYKDSDPQTSDQGFPLNLKLNKKISFFEKVGRTFKNCLVKLWIWLLVFLIFLCGITGQRMTGFRICYMALFLFFVLAFQLSWRTWTRIMYGYWLVLIVYAMTILILIYTYQFDKFDTHWKNYFGISLKLQKDIGLEKYKTKDLFLHLVNPTIVVVMTVIQVHYFHARFLDFLILSKPTFRHSTADAESSATQQMESKTLKTINNEKLRYALLRSIFRRINVFFNVFRTVCKEVSEHVWIFAEIHLMKFILVLTFWCCLSNICVLHIGFALLTVFSVVSPMKVQLFITRVISVLMAVLLLAKMIYQIDYIDHQNYDANCNTNSTMSLIYINNAEWFGLMKTTENVGLAALLRGYILYMVVVTLHAVIIFRQEYRRNALGMPIKPPTIIFEGVKRSDAEEDIIGLFKFLSNYAYFKFGYEISLIALVAVIAYRQDILAVAYVMWLCLLCKIKRSSCYKLWPSFKIFVATAIIIQYIVFVGLPPGLCMDWPWYNSHYINGLQSWAMVPGPHLYKQTTKLMFDFILLMCIYRLQRVFKLEKRMENLDIVYPAGTNKSITNEINHLDVTPLSNPVHDFISYVRNWLDILKIAILKGCFWMSLAVVFLTGTNIISIFSIGYLLGSFIFLWQGTDFYLRPVRSILKWWSILIAYNVAVITFKTVFRIGGCLFLDKLEYHSCWFVHLFGISCTQEIVTESISGVTSPLNDCPEILDNSGVMWDALCFSFLIFQLRVFKSYYFHHIITDTKASTTLASRGAEIIEHLREKQIEYKKKHEIEIIRKIKKKMENIRKKQERLLQYSADATHYSEYGLPGGKTSYKKSPPVTHPEAVRAGDYYLFEDLDEDIELTIDVKDDDYIIPQENLGSEFTRPTPISEVVAGTSKERTEDDTTNFSTGEDRGVVRKLFDSFFMSIVVRLNKTSRNYRYVMRILENEKKHLKESKGFGLGTRTGKGNIWTPFKYTRKSEVQDGGIEDYAKDFDAANHNILVKILVAVWYALLANTDLLCYIAALVNQIAAASLLSLSIPLMIFSWGTLSIPRPTKTFWITLIAYTQTIILIKCVFQFRMIWFSQSTDVLTPARIIGIQYVDGSAGYDLILLLILFFHRYLLKSQGLWKSDYRTDGIDDGGYNLVDEQSIPEESSSQEVREVAVMTKSEDPVILTQQNPTEVTTGGKTRLHVSNFIEEPGNYLPKIVKCTTVKYCSSVVVFLQDLFNKEGLPTDVYVYMFLCDFINFFILVFGFSAFDSQRADGGFQTYLEENRVPMSFLAILIMQFIFIIIDRVIYLRKAVKCRLGYHLFLVFGVHVWMFFVVPFLQGKVFNSQIPTIVFYLVKCIYFILSSYQLRCGYPTRIAGNFFAKGFSIMNMLAFKIYMMIPLLFELRTLLDWVCTDTTMTLFDWLKMEDIFVEIFSIKCIRQLESDMPVERGIKKPLLTKIFMGGGLIFVLSFLIWGPFVVFAMSSAVGISNVPYDVSISLKIGPYEQVYEMNAQDSNIHTFDVEMMDQFKAAYSKSKAAITFLSDYDPGDVAAIVLGTSSASLWSISPPDKGRFLEDLEENRTLTCRFRYTISRKSFSKENPATASGEAKFELTSDHPGRIGLMEMLLGKNSSVEVKLMNLLPKFMKVKSNGDLKNVPQLLPVNKGNSDVSIHFYTDSTTNESWWQLNEFCKDTYYHNVVGQLPLANCDSKIVIYTFSDKLFPSYLILFTAGGIIGMYTTIVLVGSRFLRAFTTGSSHIVMFEELPCVDRVFQLCLDIYLVREALEFALEEDLFAKLLFLYRSPETMIKWTRHKQDMSEYDG